MSPTYDEISNLSDEDQQRFHEYTQKSLRKQWEEARNQIETEIDLERKTNAIKRCTQIT